jgi:hypothetical protein
MQVRSPGPVGLRHLILPQDSSASTKPGCAISSAVFPTTSPACVPCAVSHISRAVTRRNSAARVSPDSWEVASEHDSVRTGADSHGQSGPCGNAPVPEWNAARRPERPEDVVVQGMSLGSTPSRGLQAHGFSRRRFVSPSFDARGL